MLLRCLSKGWNWKLIGTSQRYLFSEEPMPEYKNTENFTNKVFTHSYSDESELTPKKLVEYLDRFIIGQGDAKKAIAISFRNRWRRKCLSD